MGDRLVLWSGGGRFVASKDVAGAAIVQKSQVRIDWDVGGTALIDGTSWTIESNQDPLTQIAVSSYTGAGRVIGNAGQGFSLGFDFEGTITFFTSCINSGFWCFQIDGIWVADNLNLYHPCGSPYFALNKSNTKLFVRCTPAPLESGYNGQGFTEGTGSRITISNCPITKVISNLGEISERQTAVSPSPYLVETCAIAITYTDNSTQEIPLNYCPTWVEVQTENTCPPETCHQCTHDGETCCYAKKEDGLIHLIDRFHVTS